MLAAALGIGFALASGVGRSEARRKARRDGNPDQFALESRTIRVDVEDVDEASSIPPWCNPQFCWW